MLGGGPAIGPGGIGPTEIAAVPGLIAFANPAFQAAYQSRFSRLGQAAVPGGTRSAFLGVAGHSSGGGAVWALELLGIMLVLGLVGLVRAAPFKLARVGARVALGKGGVVTALPVAAHAARSEMETEEDEQDRLAA